LDSLPADGQLPEKRPMHNSQRWISFYDIRVTTNKKAASPPLMAEIVQALADRVEEKKALHAIGKETAFLEIAEIRVNKKRKYALMLLRISDRTAPDAFFSDPAAGTSRVERKQEGEGRGFGAHLIVSLEPEANRPDTYLMLLEKNHGLHRSHIQRLLQAVLRGQYKEEDEPFTCEDVSGARDKEGRPKMVTFRPMLELTGHPSETLVAELEAGVLKGISIVHLHPKQALSGRPWLEASEDILRFKATSTQPIKKILKDMKSFFADKASKGYQRARVKFQKADKTNDSVEFDTATGSIVDERYVKTRLIKGISPPMDDSADAIVDHFAALMEEQLLEHREVVEGTVKKQVREADAVV
jgi:hypothetical protein